MGRRLLVPEHTRDVLAAAEAGDFDEMLPLFKMYHDEMERQPSAAVKAYYGHDGSYFAEQQPFWASSNMSGREMPPNWNDHYFTDILDLGMMMLDYYEYTGDTKFAREMAIPMITDGLTFFNEHFYLGPDGKLLLDNDNAIEMYWKVTDPAPDIAGLRAILPRMIALPDDLVTRSARAGWAKMQSKCCPTCRMAMKNGQEVLLPYAGPQTDACHERRKSGTLCRLSLSALRSRPPRPRSRHPTRSSPASAGAWAAGCRIPSRPPCWG